MSHGLCKESESSSHRLGNFGLLGDSKISYISDICEVEYRSYKVLKVISKTFLNKYIRNRFERIQTSCAADIHFPESYLNSDRFKQIQTSCPADIYINYKRKIAIPYSSVKDKHCWLKVVWPFSSKLSWLRQIQTDSDKLCSRHLHKL